MIPNPRDHRDDGTPSLGCITGLVVAFLVYVFVTGIVFLIVR
jgi:hypothetical protein